jgi:glycosyltransferase involved in cell wall biosynthesis
MVKVLIVAPTPPATNLGLPIMIEVIVRSQMRGVELRHVRLAVSANESQVGKFRWMKMLRVFPIIARVIYQRIVHGPQLLYYAPAGATTMGMLRDVAILGCTRFLFPKTILHFHAGGHGEFYERLGRFKRWLFRLAYFRHEAAIRLSEMTPEDGKALKARREFIVPNGIADPGADMPLPHPAPVISASRPLHVLFVALLCEAKGLLVLIEACGLLAARGVPFELNLMGRFESPEFEARARSRMRELGIEDQVRFLGVLKGEEKFAAFARCDVLCHPTFKDTFGLVIVEAMGCGVPVVATRHCSIPLIVDEGQTGFLVEENDSAGLADRLAELADDPRLRRDMGIAGRAKFLREYTLPRFIERMRQVFLDVAGELPADEEAESHDEFAPAGSAYTTSSG